MTNLAKALLETHDVELEPGDSIALEHHYCGNNIVDVIIDTAEGDTFIFYAYDISKGIFPY